LVHEAPRTFFVGASSSVLLEFDERFRQVALAPEEKRSVLAGLPESLLWRAFDPFDSYGGELSGHLLRGEPEPTVGGLPEPCIFHPAEARPGGAEGLGADPEREGQRGWTELLRSSEGEWARAAAEVLTWLKTGVGAEAQETPVDAASVSVLAKLAVTRCLLSGEPALAAELARAGMDRVPQDRELAYLRRIAEQKAPTGIRHRW